MIIDPQSVQIGLDVDFFAEDYEEILQNVKTIVTTPVGTVPLDRDFGVDFTVLDLPINQVQARYTVEVISKIRKYEPRCKVLKVTYEYNGETGKVTPKVVLQIVGA